MKNLFELTSEEKDRLRKFAGDQTTLFALKKLFLNICISEPASNEAIRKITEAFHDLSNISPEIKRKISEDNLI